MCVLTRCPAAVGHNCFFDLLFIYQAFVAPLPTTLQEFKHEVRTQAQSAFSFSYRGQY